MQIAEHQFQRQSPGSSLCRGVATREAPRSHLQQMCVFQNGCLSERQAPGPVLEQISEMTLNIEAVRTIGRYWNSRTSEYPETHALLKVRGVGHITVLTYVLTLGARNASNEVGM
jgi:hypothetical protein